MSHSISTGAALLSTLIVSLVLPPALAAPIPQPLNFVGRAFNLDTGQLAYTEEHQVQASGIDTVIYREPDGQQFATKTMDFSAYYFTPDVDQYNTRNGEIIRITRKDSATLTTRYRASSAKKETDKFLPAGADTVVDAGFHPYILAHWDSLVGGVPETIEYVVPSWQRGITLKIEAVACADAHPQCFTIKPANVLLSAFASAVELTYDPQSRQIIEFRGTSNIAQKNGDYERVRIVYKYAASGLAVSSTTDADSH